MFWRFGGYTDDSTTDTLLDKPEAPSRWNSTGKRNERRPGVPSSMKDGPVGVSKGNIQFGSITDSPAILQNKRGRSKRSTSNSPLRATNVMAGNDSGNTKIPLQRVRDLQFKHAEEQFLEQTPWASPQHLSQRSVARATTREGKYNDNNTLRGPRSQAPITSQDSTEVPPERIKRICVSYTISEDMSGDRENKILSRISHMKRGSREVKLRERGSHEDRWSLKHQREAVGDANGAFDQAFTFPQFDTNEQLLSKQTHGLTQGSTSSSPPQLPTLTPEQRELKRQRGLTRRDSKTQMRRERTTNNLNQFDKSSSNSARAEDYPEIPGEEQRNPHMAGDQSQVNRQGLPKTPGDGKRRPGRPPKDPVAFFAARAARLGPVQETEDELREEAIMNAVAERRSQAVATDSQPSDIDQEFLDALPDDVRDEIIQQERQDRRRRSPYVSRAGSPNNFNPPTRKARERGPWNGIRGVLSPGGDAWDNSRTTPYKNLTTSNDDWQLNKRNRPDVEELLERPWCYYCERDFDDLKMLISHQKAQHFQCGRCGRRLNTAGGLSVHMNQVHRETLSSVEKSLPNRQGLEVEIFGMEGIPKEVAEAYNQRIIAGDGNRFVERTSTTTYHPQSRSTPKGFPELTGEEVPSRPSGPPNGMTMGRPRGVSGARPGPQEWEWLTMSL